MTREQGVDLLYEQSMRIGCKMQEFREAIKSLKALEEFNLQACINDQDSSKSATGSSSSEWSVEEVLKTAISTKLGKMERAYSTIRQQTPTNRTAISSLPSVSPCKCKAGEERDTEVCKEGFKRDEAGPPPDGILETCSYINTQDLFLVLRRHWISTMIMEYWLPINAGRVHGVRICPSTLATMRDRRWSNACSVSFNFCHCHRLDELDAFLFLVWRQSHFYLLVACPRLKRWDYYNTMGWRKRQYWEYALAFKEYVCTEFASRGWVAMSWEIHNIASCPQLGSK